MTLAALPSDEVDPVEVDREDDAQRGQYRSARYQPPGTGQEFGSTKAAATRAHVDVAGFILTPKPWKKFLSYAPMH